MNPTIDHKVDAIALLERYNIPVEPVSSSTYYLDLSAQPSHTDALWAADKLGELPVDLRYSKTTRVYAFEMPDGDFYRRVGTILVRPEPTEERQARFVINIRVGATDDDLRWLRWVVERAKAGSFLNDGWHSMDEPGVFGFTLSRKFDPLSWARWGAIFIVPCHEPGCDDFGGHHLTMDLADPDYLHMKDGGGYAYCMKANTDDRWVVYASVDGSLTPSEIAGLTSGLKWVAADCAQLNATLAAAEGRVVA